MTTALIFIIVLAILIFVHELGHFLAARVCGMRVEAFKIGFGPRILHWQKGETEYGVNLIPFGGYVKIFGENPVDQASGSESDNRARSASFIEKSRWQQALVLFAGVLFNFLFAWMIYSILFVSGITVTTDGFEKYSGDFANQRIMVTDVRAASPAAEAGLMVGDIIDNVESTNIESVSKIQELINAGAGHPVTLQYSRQGTLHQTQIIPVRGIVENKYAIGIAMQSVADLKLPFFEAIYEGGHYTIVLIRETATGLYGFVTDIFRGAADFSSVAGPIGIAGIVGDAAKLGLEYLLMITAIISINLGVINLIPFPALDGGRILFVGIEGVIRRRIPARFFNITNTVGFVLLMILMVIVTYKDVLKLFV